jgi:hypothetical protein
MSFLRFCDSLKKIHARPDARNNGLIPKTEAASPTKAATLEIPVDPALKSFESSQIVQPWKALLSQ